MGRRGKFLWSVGALLALYAAAGFLVAPPIVKSKLEATLGEALQRKVTVEAVRVNPFAPSLTVRGLAVRERDGEALFAGFDELYANVSWSSVLRLAPVLEEITLAKPRLHIRRGADRRYNFEDLLRESGGGGGVPRFALSNIRVVDGSVEFDDRAGGARHALTEIAIGIPHLSSLPAHAQEKVRPEVAMKVNGAPLRLGGDAQPFESARPADLALDVQGFDLTRLVPYLPFEPKAKLASALLDARVTVHFEQSGGKPQVKLGGEAAIRNLALRDLQDRPLLAWERLAVALNEAEPLAARVDVKSVELQGADVSLRREKDGVFNFARLAPPSAPGSSSPSTPFLVKVDRIAVAPATLHFTDDAARSAVALTLELTADGLSTEKGKAGNASVQATVAKTGRIAASGSLTLDPFATRMEIDVQRLGVVPAQPYLDDFVHLAVTSGAVSAKGVVAAELPPGKSLQATYKGRLGLSDFASVDKRSTQDLLKWKSLALDGIDFDLGARKLSLDAIALSDYYARIIVSPEGRLNLQDLAVQHEKPKEEKKTHDNPFKVRIGKVALQGGNVNFSDFFIKPNYSANLTRVGGSVTEMSAEKAGQVDLRGRIDNAAPLEILGSVNPLGSELFLDMKASARDIELAPLSPYSVKYAGYGIERGKLSLNVKYHIEHRKLAAENQVYLDQLTFGAERIDSPTATTLPVTFAISLLKDRNGVIDLHLPISGSLDDPQFSLLGIIAKVVGNLIVKAVTAPFALLGSLFGGGAELSFLEFAPGSAALDDDDRGRLGKLAKALGERPGLKLEAAGRADPSADRDGLKRAALAAKVRAQKFNDLRRAGKAPASAADVTVEPAEYERYLRRAYAEEKFPKPRTALGTEKELPVEEMETLILTHAAVGEDDLRLLANARSQAAKEWLVDEGKVPAERVFIVAPRLTPDDVKDAGKPTRVDFSLK
ncbi:MAG TPA: DUF748 domain-containing protein [Burkholderiales bacterium]|nr:DUF748 domain-containing protein [Burkholderiales bacterium]